MGKCSSSKERNISWVILNVVRIRLDHYDGVLHRMGVFKTENKHGMYQYILVCTSMYWYILVCTSMISKCNEMYKYDLQVQ